MILRVLRSNIAGAGLYLILGVSINVIFKDYVLYSVLQFIYTNPNTVSIPMYFAQMNVVNPFFIQTMTIVNMFLNLITISGLFLIFKVKGVLLYACYYAFFALLFGMSALF
jgi:hypothetical protein